MKKLLLPAATLVLLLALSVVVPSLVRSFSGGTPSTVIENVETFNQNVSGQTDSLGAVSNVQDIFSAGIDVEKGGVKQNGAVFNTRVLNFANATSTLCNFVNNDPQQKDWFVFDTMDLIGTAATTTATFTVATSTTPYADSISPTNVMLGKISTSTKAVITMAENSVTNTGIAKGGFFLPYEVYAQFSVAAENAILAGALNDGTETLAGRCIMRYVESR